MAEKGEWTVLIVEDEPDLAETLELWLEEIYEVKIAHDGETALEIMENDIDAVLLDRRMPGLTGDEVLSEIRDRGYECPVIMTTVVDPDLNVLEMEFDDYLKKPVSPMTVLEVLEHHLEQLRSERERLREYFSIVSKLSVLEPGQGASGRNRSNEYRALEEREAELREELAESIADFEEIVETYREIERI